MSLWTPSGSVAATTADVGGGSPSTLLTDLVSWLDLIANGTDDHDGNDLSAAGSPSFGTVDGQACVTTSPGNHLYRASTTGLALDTMTVAAWIRRTGSSSLMQVLTLGTGVTPGTMRYALRCDDDDMDFRVSDGSGAAIAEVPNIITVSTWIHVIGDYDSATGEINLYINGGASSANANSGYTTLNAVDGIGIGGDGDGTGTAAEFEGAIKCAAVWSRVLTSGERTELYNGGAVLLYADIPS